MGRCSVCGKHGLLLHIDEKGRCRKCAEKEMIAEREAIAEAEREEAIAFEAYYDHLLRELREIQQFIDIGYDPIRALDFVPIINDIIRKCDVLRNDIHNPRFVDRLVKKLVNSISFRDDFNKRNGMGELKLWETSVIADRGTNSFSKETILSALDKRIALYKQEWVYSVDRIHKSARFQQELDSITSYEVYTSDTKHSRLSASNLNELIKYSNITSKTNYEQTGNFVVLDTETTGLNLTDGRLVEVAAVRFADWSPVEKFNTLINPGKPIPKDASAVNGITDEMVKDAPSFSQVIDCLDQFVGKSNIVGHNLPFDLKFLYHFGYDFTSQKRKYYDTCEIAQKILKKPKMKWDKELEMYVESDSFDYDVENHQLTTLCDYYGIRDNYSAHRALSDALETGHLFKMLVLEKVNR